MAQRDRAWPINPFCCRNVAELSHECLLAFTITREALEPKATSFANIASPETRQLFHLFLELCSRLSEQLSGKVTCALEQVLDARGVSTIQYTFYLVVRDWHGSSDDPCDAQLTAIIADAITRENRFRHEHPKPWQSWHALTGLARIKACLQRHANYVAPAGQHETAEQWGGAHLSAHLIFSLGHAFISRDRRVHASQNLWCPIPYIDEDRLCFPKPRFVYVVQDQEVREPSLLYARMLPDWQAQCTPSTVIQFADALLMPDGESARCFDRLGGLPVRDVESLDAPEQRVHERVREINQQTLGVVIDMDQAHQADESRPTYTQEHTYDSLRKLGLARLARIEGIAQNASPRAPLANPLNAARRLYDVHQRLGIESHVAHMRGAFPTNVSPQTRALMTFAEEHVFAPIPLPVFKRQYADLDRFCNREAWRWKHFSETYLVADHNVEIMMLIFYASLDAYSYDLINRVGLNVLLLSEEGGLGKSMMIKNVLELIRVKLRITTYMTGKSKAVSSKFGEQAYNMYVFEELSEQLVSDKTSAANNEVARIFKTMLSNSLMHAEYLHLDRATGEREPRADESLWIGCVLSAANIDGLLSWKMPPPMIDRLIPITVDQSDRAVRMIVEKIAEASAKTRDPAFIQRRDDASNIFKKEEFVYAEARMLERETAVRSISDDVAAVVCDWLSRELEEAGHPPCARNRNKICALACVVAGVDAVDSVYFDDGGVAANRPYDARSQPEVERRSWVKAAHMVHVVGMAPYLFMDVDERDVRLALCEEFEAMDRTKYRFASSGKARRRRFEPNYPARAAEEDDDCSDRDLAYAAFGSGRRGFGLLAERLQTRLSHCKGRRTLLTRDAIQYRLQQWTRRTNSCREWYQVDGEQWPVEEHEGDEAHRAIAKMIELPGGAHVYQVQISWIHRDKLPLPAKTTLLRLLRSLFACSEQGGFAAPYGVDPVTRRIRIVNFPKAGPRAKPLVVPGSCNDAAKKFVIDLDAWGLTQHNRRLYVERSAMRRLGGFASADARDDSCYFSGRPLGDLLPQKAIGEGVAMAELMADPGDEDADAPDEACQTADLCSRVQYHWEPWCMDEVPGQPWPPYVSAKPDDTPEDAAAKHKHNRGSYKLIAVHPRIEEERIRKQLKERDASEPSASWKNRSRPPRLSQKRKWKNIKLGIAKTVDAGGLVIPGI